MTVVESVVVVFCVAESGFDGSAGFTSVLCVLLVDSVVEEGVDDAAGVGTGTTVVVDVGAGAGLC